MQLSLPRNWPQVSAGSMPNSTNASRISDNVRLRPIRSGATIIGGLCLGLSRKAAAEFTFFLAIPVMFGASLLKVAGFGLDFTGRELLVLFLGMATAFGVSLLVIRFLMQFVQKNDFRIFGWYRIVLGILVFIFFFFRK